MRTIMKYYSFDLNKDNKVYRLLKEMKHYKKQLIRWAKAIGADRLNITFYWNEYIGYYALGSALFDDNNIAHWTVGKYSKGHYKFKDVSKCYAD